MPDTPRQRAWRRFRRNRPAIAATGLLGFVLLACLLGPVWAPHGANAGSDFAFAPPDARHWFGTDIHGRDLFARVLVGTRISLLVGLVGAGVSVVIGVTWGMIAAYAGGRTDTWMMRVVDILYALPNIIFVMLAISLLETQVLKWLTAHVPSLTSAARLLLLFTCLGAVSWLNMARVIRGQVLSLRERPFIQASRALGAGMTHILWRHLLPNLSGIILVYAALTLPAVILYESFLSFLGLGIRPPDASLGTLIEDGARQLNPLQVRWWLLLAPGGVLAVTLLAFQWLGDGLRDAWDPHGDRAGK
jgi:oligopeptide transport system permease protein